MNEDLLAQLRDIHLPAEPGFWPPAPGWWLLAALVLGAIAALVIVLLRRHQRASYRREAEALLATLWADYQSTQDGVSYLQGVNQVLRRTALLAYPRERVAGLTSGAWLGFLDRSLGNKSADKSNAPFRKGPGRALVSAAYRPQWSGKDAEALQQLAVRWLRDHRQVLPPIKQSSASRPIKATEPNNVKHHARV